MTDDDTHALSLRFCEALSVNVYRQPGEWRSATLIAAHARIRHAAEANRAVSYAHEQGWLDVDSELNVCLTEKGRGAA